MNKKLLKALCLLMAMFMCVGVLASCVKKQTAESKTEPPAQTQPKEDTTTKKEDTKPKTPEEILASGDLIKPDPNIKFPISEKPIKLRFMKPYIMYDTEYGELAILKDYAKKTNIEIEWDIPPQANFKEKYTLAMNTGNLPDAVIAPLDVEKYGQQGAFIDLKPIIESYMINLKKAFEKYPYAKKVVTTDDGKVYSMPYIYQFVAGNNVMMVRKDLLNKYNLEMPVTTEDWYNVMKTLKEREGITPFSGYGESGKGMNAAISMIAAWGVYPHGLYIAEKLYPNDNKVHYGPIEPRFKEGIEWLRKLYAEGLIDPEIVTNDSKAFQAKALQGKVACWRGWINSDMNVLNTTAQKEGKTEDQFAVREAPIMKGPYGDQFHMWPDNPVIPNGMVITSTNKYPKETAIWADYWYGEVGQTYVYGVEGVTYTIVNGEPKWTDFVLKNPDGKTMNEVRGMVTFGRSIWPTIFQPWSLTAATVPEYVEVDRKKYRDPEKFVLPIVPGLSFSAEENSLISQKLTDIQTYVDEALVNFILGKKPMSEWDNYVSTVKDMGIDKIIEIYEKSYERWKKR
ncbi:MAG: extracellular solute-binding protein [Firmicutes bacterium]|nr:extracellular solute-binding protein [Bacillota bacterium]